MRLRSERRAKRRSLPIGLVHGEHRSEGDSGPDDPVRSEGVGDGGDGALSGGGQAGAGRGGAEEGGVFAECEVVETDKVVCLLEVQTEELELK